MDSLERSYIELVIVMLFWGGSWPIAKVLVASIPPFTVGLFRFMFASLLFALMLYSRRSSLSVSFNRRFIVGTLLLGVTGVFGYGVFFLFGLQYTTSAQGVIIAGANPALISLFAYFFHKERLPRPWQYSGLFLSMLGIVFVVGVQALLDYNPDYLIGNILIFLAMICWATYSNIGKSVMKETSPLITTAGASVVGTFLFLFPALTEQFWTGGILLNIGFWLGVGYLGAFATVVGFLLYFRGIHAVGATKAAIFINLVPIIGTLLSVVFLHEPLYWPFVVGLVLVVSGITIINLRPPVVEAESSPQ